MQETRLVQATPHQIQVIPVETQEQVLLERATLPEQVIQQAAAMQPVQAIIPPVQAVMLHPAADVRIHQETRHQETQRQKTHLPEILPRAHQVITAEIITSEIWKTPIIITNHYKL